MERKIKKYELKQHGKKFVLSSQIYEDKLRLACIEETTGKKIIYIGEFTVSDLIQLNSFFESLTEIGKAQELLDILMLKQKVNIGLEENYLNLNVIIKTENQPENQFTIRLKLFNQEEKNINIQTTTETKINQYNLNVENNNLDENLLQSPDRNDNELNQYTQQNAEEIAIQKQNIKSNINVSSENQLISSPKINTEEEKNININYEEQYIQPQNNEININSQEKQYIESNNNIISQDLYNPSSQVINNETSSSVDNFIQQFLQSSGNASTTQQETQNIISSQEHQTNTNSLTEQYVGDININQILQEKQISNVENNTNEITGTQTNQINTYNDFQNYNIQQQVESIDNVNNANVNKTDNYIQQHVENEYIQSIPQQNTNITSTTNTQTQYIQIPTGTITTQKQYVIQNQPVEGQTVNYNYTQNQVVKRKRIKTDQIVLTLLPEPEEPKIEETNYETSAQIYTQVKEPEIPIPQIVYKDNPELDSLRNENARLLQEINSLKSQINTYISEIKTLKIHETIKPEVQTNNQEVFLLRQEIVKLRMELDSYNQYKIQKEDEINLLNMKIKNLLIRLQELETRNENLRAYIEKSSKMISDNENMCEALTIQDTRLEIIRGDIIESPNELELLTRRMCQGKYKKISMNLIYKAIVDSDKAEIFHNKCDSAERTLVLVKSANGKRFGGFTSCSWEGNSVEKKDETAFVFSLDKMKIYDVIKGEDAIGCYPNFGPVFLGCQIRIYDDFFKKGGSTYEKGMNFDTQEDYELSGGLKQFNVKDIEVYSIELFQ